MVIRAKFDGRCTACNGAVRVGAQVNYAPGVRGVSHVQCPAAPEPVPAFEAKRFPLAGPVPDGTFTAVFDATAKDYCTIRVRLKGPESKWAGRRLVSFYTHGSERCFGEVEGGTVRIWTRWYSEHRALARAEAALTVIAGDPGAAGEAYALESNRCWRCDRRLSVPASICRGVGPECAKKLAVAA